MVGYLGFKPSSLCLRGRALSSKFVTYCLVPPLCSAHSSTVLQTVVRTTFTKAAIILLGRSMGIEPMIAESQPAVLPLN